MNPTTFKYKHVDDEGNATGFFSSNGTYDGEVLALESQQIPIDAMVRATKRFNRLALSYLNQYDEVYTLVIEVTSANGDRIAQDINARVSRQIIEMRRRALAEEGRESELQSEECPYCGARIDLTGLKRTEECYCSYCETVFSTDGRAQHDEREYAICDECGYYARPREFTSFYFYFLLVVYGWRYGKRYMCTGCMRGEAWKMFFANFLFVIGVPVAIYQLVRAYTGDLGGPYQGLASANIDSSKGRFAAAADQYRKLLDRGDATVGLHYNAAVNAIDQGDFERAGEHVEQGLALCSNHRPTYDMGKVAVEYADVEVDLSGREEADDAMDQDLEDDLEFADVEW